MFIFLTEDGLVVAIHTANLVENDWHQKTQGIWISPLLPVRKDEGSLKISSFQSDLIAYLRAYNLNALKEWIDMINNHNFSDVKAHLVGSVPGRHTGSLMYDWGHLKLQKLLAQVQYLPNLVLLIYSNSYY